MLMGISETIESRKAERSSVRSSVPVLEMRAPALQSPRAFDVMAVSRAPTHRGLRRMKAGVASSMNQDRSNPWALRLLLVTPTSARIKLTQCRVDCWAPQAVKETSTLTT